MKKLSCFSVLLVLVGTTACIEAQTGDPKAIQQILSSKIRITATTADRSDIVTPGDVVQIKKPGLVMYSVASPMPPANTYKNGRIAQGWGGFGQDLVIGMASPGGTTAANYPHRQFVAGENCWVTGLHVEKDSIVLQLYSDPYDNVRYYANLKIPFANRNEVPSVDAALQLVAEVLTLVPQDSAGGQQPPVPGAGNGANNEPAAISGQYVAQSESGNGPQLILYADGTFTRSVGGRQAQGQFAVNEGTLTLTFSSGRVQNLNIQNSGLYDPGFHITYLRAGDAPSQTAENASGAPGQDGPPSSDTTPPPVPSSIASVSPQTIRLGQSIDQVTAILGDPISVARVGGKTVFVYSDLKVTFTNGKVFDVE
jgi:hypothetical protein